MIMIWVEGVVMGDNDVLCVVGYDLYVFGVCVL